MFDDLLPRIQPDTLILTANKRLANWFAHLHHQHQQTHNIAVWLSPDILPFTSWLQRCYIQLQAKSCGSTATLLNQPQELSLWQQIIKATNDNPLLPITPTAITAQQAWQLLQQYQIDLTDTEIQQNTELNTWINEFTQRCKHNDWLDNASLLKTITTQLAHRNLTTTKHIILVGFLEFKPAEQKLIDTLKTLGIIVETYQSSLNQQKNIRRTALPNTEHEIYAMAHWAKQQTTHTACVIPNLNAIHNDIRRIFQKVFANDPKKFNISYGSPLMSEPTIYTALEILRLTKEKISIQDVGYILRSPFLNATTTELCQQALIDIKLRKLNQTKFNLTQLINAITNIDPTCKILKSLQLLQQIKNPTTQTANAWTETFTQQLIAMNWSGVTTKIWQELLQNFITLDLINNSFSFYQALTQLKQIATLTPFQTKSNPFAPVQILGLLEATGLHFDNIWVMGLDDNSLPAPAKPNPLLPITLQKKYHMPHSSAEREYNFGLEMIQQFTQHATNIVFSYPQQLNDEQLQPSLLIKNFRLVQTATPQSFAPTTPTSFTTIEDEVAPTIQPSENFHAATATLEKQAACPFSAFATYRLHAEEIPQPEEGINNLDRGSLIHKALELIWQQLQTHKDLLAADKANLKDLIKNHVDKALTTLSSTSTLKKLEQQLLQQIIFSWLEIEKTRVPFTVVAQEQKYAITCGKLKFNIRIDRIDQLENQKYILIDYKSGKSGKASIKDCLGDRPNKPQLPLYAINLSTKPDAIAFAQLKPTELKFSSIGTNKKFLPNSQELTNNQWQQQLQAWQQITTKLANEFYAGDARVAPKNPNETCKFCKLHTLCRIYENN